MRRAASLLCLALLVFPLTDAVRLARIRVADWSRMRARHHEPPDAAWDRYYAQLRYLLPATGRVGIVQTARQGTDARAHEYYFLQYALAPRLLVPNGDEEFVIACGPPAAAAALVDGSRFVAVKQLENVTLYRRVRP